MKLRTALLILSLLAAPALAQSGLKVSYQGEPGLDPSFARGWLAPDYDRFGFALYNWRETVGFAPGQRVQLSYSPSDRYNLGMSMANTPYFDEQRQVSVFGSYSLTPDWALSAESLSRDPLGLFLLRDFRIGVQRRF